MKEIFLNYEIEENINNILNYIKTPLITDCINLENKSPTDYIDIIYKYNNYGYRDEDFIKNKPADLLTLGCSHTYGVGLPIEKTWPSLLSQDLNVTMHNLGVSGDSAIGQVHRAFWYFENVGVPKKIAAMFASNRMLTIELPSKNKTTVSNKNVYKGIIIPAFLNNKIFKNYSKAPHIFEEVVSEENAFLYTFLAISILQSFCKVNNIEFVFYIYESIDKKIKEFFNNFCNLEEILKEENAYENNFNCHKQYEEDPLFYAAADRKLHPSMPGRIPHWGFHVQLHIFEEFMKYFKNK